MTQKLSSKPWYVCEHDPCYFGENTDGYGQHCKTCNRHYMFNPACGPDTTGLCNDCEQEIASAQYQRAMEAAEEQGLDPYAAIENIPPMMGGRW